MVKYQKYAEYKDSGIDWLGSIPSHWNAVNLGYLFDITSSKRVFEDQWKSEGVPFYRAREIVRLKKDQDYQNDLFISKSLYTELRKTYGVPQVGDILVTAVGTLGVTYLVENRKEFYFKDGNLIWLKTNNKCDSTFINYCYESFVIKYQMYRDNMGATVGTYTIENAKKNKIFLPPLDEQIAITHFLNNQTQVIDTLIAKQEKLIELLKEKRQAVISHAVTKGLNPNVVMKDSGVEWLGKVPEHWEVRQLRYLGSCQNGINIGAEYFGSGSPFISYGDVYRNPELPSVFEGLVQSTENDKRIYSVQRGDVLFTRTSETIEEIGFSSTCLTDVKDATFAGFLIRFRPIQNTLLPEYSKFYFRNILLRAFFVKEMNLVTRASLSQELLKKLAVPFSSLEEQKQIADFLSAKERVFDKLVNDCIKQIELLKERRTALISSAVTGKIDVRNWQHPKEAKTELSL